MSEANLPCIPARHHGPFYPRMDGPGSPLGRGVLPWPRTWPWRANWIREGSLASHDMAVYLSNNGNANAIRNARTITECDELHPIGCDLAHIE